MYNMAKKSVKIAATYIITILMTLLIIGGIFYLLLQRLLNPQKKDESLPTLDPLASTEEYVPSSEDNTTSLFIFDSAKRESGNCFMIVRMAAEERKIILMPIPANTYIGLDGTYNTLYDFYRTGGTAKAVSAASSALGIDIDYYLKMDNNSFSAIVDTFGGVDFDIPYNLIYSDAETGEETVFREGEVYLESDSMRKIFTFPDYKSGEEYRAKIIGVIISDLINKNVKGNFSANIDTYFNNIINSSIETNYTAYDYQEQSDAMKYIAESSDRIAQLVTVTGNSDENGNFILDENFIRAVPEWLRIYNETDDTETLE